MSLEQRLAEAYLEAHPPEAAMALERLPAEQRAAVVRTAPSGSSDALRQMVAPAAAECLARLTRAEAAPLLERLPPDVAIRLLRRMGGDTAERVIGGLTADRQESLRRVLQYAEGTAGALMDPTVLALPDDITVGEARVRLRREPRGLLHYLYVVDRTGRLAGVLDIPGLLRARSRDALRAVMHQGVEHLPAWTPAGAVRGHPGWRSFHAMPVTDDAGRFVGAIRYRTLRRLEQEAETGRGAQPATVTAGALGELFHLGMAGFIEGVAAAAAPQAGRTPSRPADEGGGR